MQGRTHLSKDLYVELEGMVEAMDGGITVEVIRGRALINKCKHSRSAYITSGKPCYHYRKLSYAT